MSSAQPANRPTTDSPVGARERVALSVGFPIVSGYYDPDSSSFDDDGLEVDAGLSFERGDSEERRIREFVTAT